MKVTLQVVNGPLARRMIFLRSGQRAEVGRTEWADFTFPHDPDMADVHFVVECQDEQCVIHDRNTQTGTLVNGQSITETKLFDGAEIIAGQTQFRVSIEDSFGSIDLDESGSQASSPSEMATQAETSAENSSPLAADFCRNLDLEDDALALLAKDAHQFPAEYLAQLVGRELLVDAIRFQAQILPKRQAIWWALSCVRDLMPESVPDAEKHRIALDVAETWLADPQEKNRRHAENAARALNYETPAAWVAMAVFWSEGSIAPPETEVVAPADHLTGVAASAALLLAATTGPAVDVANKQREFLSLAGQPAPPPTDGSH